MGSLIEEYRWLIGRKGGAAGGNSTCPDRGRKEQPCPLRDRVCHCQPLEGAASCAAGESLAGNGFPVKWRKISAKYLEIV